MHTSASIDPHARIGAVHLTIADLDRSIRFYEEHLGFVVHARAAGTASLGGGRSDLLVLVESRSAPGAPRATGLYHFAVLVPSRPQLARSLQRLVATNTRLQGVSDHGVSESLYLADPDGNGIEIYRDRPRDEWPVAGGHLRMTIDPLDVDRLLNEADGTEPLPRLAEETVIGHVHLRVSNLPDTERFYTGVLGFDVMQRLAPGALFVAAGGYHHHIGLNTWAGVGAPPPPPGAIGLRHFVVELSSAEALAAVADRITRAGLAAEHRDDGVIVRDPSHNTILITPVASRRSA